MAPSAKQLDLSRPGSNTDPTRLSLGVAALVIAMLSAGLWLAVIRLLDCLI